MQSITQDLINTPDSQVTFGKNKRLKDITDLAETKFGAALIKVSVNREDKCFDVFVESKITDSIAKEFEVQWFMCKVQIFKPITRKK